MTDGIESALEQARAAAGDRDIVIAGGAETVRQFLAAGLLDELEFHQIPEIVSAGARLLEGLPPEIAFEQVRVVEGTGVTHLKYRVVR